jgi:hypothetical protein
VEQQLHFDESRITREMAKEVPNFICIAKHRFLQSILQSSNQLEGTRTKVNRIEYMIKSYHVIAPHIVNAFLSVVAARVVHVHGQFDPVFSAAPILRFFRSDNTTLHVLSFSQIVRCSSSCIFSQT